MMEAPFTDRLFPVENVKIPVAQDALGLSDDGTIPSPFPASFQDIRTLPVALRIKGSKIVTINTVTLLPFLELEFSLHFQDTNTTRFHLWGTRQAPKALNQQLVLNRTFVLTERMDQHLVWWGERIFLKPIPRYLLNSSFWVDHLSCLHDEYPCCRRRTLRRCALGFLYSYVSLVQYETDFTIAKDLNLIPQDVRWDTWHEFVKTLARKKDFDQQIHERFNFGELRVHPEFSVWPTFADALATSFRHNLGWLGTAAAYIALVLTAMQLGLGTNQLAQNDVFHAASYGFTVFSIVGPIGIAVFLIIAKMILPYIFYLYPNLVAEYYIAKSKRQPSGRAWWRC